MIKLPASRIGLGLAALGRPGYITLGHAADLSTNYDINAMRQHAVEVLDTAWAMGVRYFDAARSYGQAEQFLADWLRRRQIDPAAVTVGSKWGYTYTANWQTQATVHEVKDHRLPALQRQWRESQAVLGPYLKLYQVHSATLDSGLFDNSAVLDELARLKQSAVAIGLTLSGPAQADTLRRAVSITIDGQRLFDTVQATWNLLESSAGSALHDAHAIGMTVIVKEALANGRLTERNTNPGFQMQRKLLLEHADRLHTTLDGLALAAVLAQPWADMILSGAATSDQINSNRQALNVLWDDEARTALSALSESSDAYWAYRKQLAWN